jgi:hypothetical protein
MQECAAGKFHDGPQALLREHARTIVNNEAVTPADSTSAAYCNVWDFGTLGGSSPTNTTLIGGMAGRGEMSRAPRMFRTLDK